MELDCPPPPAEPVVPSLPYTKDPYVADLLRVADENMAKVKEECTALKEERDGLQVKLDSFRKQVSSISFSSFFCVVLIIHHHHYTRYMVFTRI